MRSKMTLGLAAIALGCGVAGASAATLNYSKSADATASPLQGHGSSGLSALQGHRDSGSQGSAFIQQPADGAAVTNGLVRPDTHAWHDGIAAISAVSPNLTKGRADSENALSPPPGTPHSNGFAAIQAASGQHGATGTASHFVQPDAGAPAATVFDK